MNDTSKQWMLKNWVKKVFSVMMLLFIGIFILSSMNVKAVPQGPTIIYNQTLNVTPTPAAQITTPGGSFTTIILNATTQTPRWKAYVGNVSGKLALDDGSSKSIFDWTLSSVTGEVYSTRNNSIDWSAIACAGDSAIITEQSALNMSSGIADNLNRTFSSRVHKRFYVGTTVISNSTCPSIATYVNDSPQANTENAVFQEIMLMDSESRIVYATLIDQNTTGFNGQKYDFQMIVPENEFQSVPTTYYLYAELT